MTKNIKQILVLVSFFITMVLTACSKNSNSIVPSLIEPPSAVMEKTVAYKGDLSNIWLYDGWVEPAVTELSFQKAGRLTAITVSIGDMVHEGDVIAYMEDETLTNQLKNLKEEAEKQKENYNYEITLLDYEIQLAETGQDIKTAKLRKTHLIQERDLKLKQMEEKIKKMEQEVSKLILTAPISGEVVYINQGRLKESVDTGTIIAGIAQDTLYLRSAYMEPDRLLDASNLYALIGREKIELTSIPYTQQELMILKAKGGELKGTFAFTHDDIKAGDYGCIVLETLIKEDVLLIPAEAVHKDSSGYEYVNMIKQGEQVRQRIKTGARDSQMVEVAEGLAEGEVVYLESGKAASFSEIEEGANYVAETGSYTETFSISGLDSIYLESAFISIKEAKGEFLRYTKEIGEEVKKGDILAEYSLPYDEIKIEESRFLYKRTLDNYKEEKGKRQKRLKELRTALELLDNSNEEREKQKILLKIEEAKYNKYCKDTEEALQIQKVKLEEMENQTKVQYLYAAMDGIIQNRQPLSQGDSIAFGEGIIYLLNPDSFVWVLNNVSQNLKYNMEIQIEDPLSKNKNSYTGRVVSADNIMSDEAKTMTAYIKLEDPNAEFQKNTALLKAVTKKVEEVIVLDSDMVVTEDRNKSYVYISYKDEISKRPVLVKGEGEKLFIYKGLSKGEPIQKVNQIKGEGR